MLQPPALKRQETEKPELFKNPRTGRWATYGSRTHRELIRDGVMDQNTLPTRTTTTNNQSPTLLTTQSPRKKAKIIVPESSESETETEDESESGEEEEYTKEELEQLTKYFSQNKKPGDRLRASLTSFEEE